MTDQETIRKEKKSLEDLRFFRKRPGKRNSYHAGFSRISIWPSVEFYLRSYDSLPRKNEEGHFWIDTSALIAPSSHIAGARNGMMIPLEDRGLYAIYPLLMETDVAEEVQSLRIQLGSLLGMQHDRVMQTLDYGNTTVPDEVRQEFGFQKIRGIYERTSSSLKRFLTKTQRREEEIMRAINEKRQTDIDLERVNRFKEEGKLDDLIEFYQFSARRKKINVSDVDITLVTYAVANSILQEQPQTIVTGDKGILLLVRESMKEASKMLSGRGKLEGRIKDPEGFLKRAEIRFHS